MNVRRALVGAAVVAALPAVFAATAEAPPGTAPPGAQSCSGCHPGGAGAAGPVPALVGRQPAEIVAQMQAFRSGQREATVMDQIAKGFSDAEVEAIAAWYAEQR